MKGSAEIKQFGVRFLTPITLSQLCVANRGLAGWLAGWHGAAMSPLHANPAQVRNHATDCSPSTCVLKEAKCGLDQENRVIFIYIHFCAPFLAWHQVIHARFAPMLRSQGSI